MITKFYATVFGTKDVLIFVCTQRKLETAIYDLENDFNSCLTDFLKQIIQKSELVWKDPYGWRYYLN